jgi:DNA-directed RNA polymerase specialized sigma24 family protein
MKIHVSQGHAAHAGSQLRDRFTNLLVRAVQGDRRAIGAIAASYGPWLLKEARDALGPERASEDEDVLQDLLVGMTHGTFEFVPGRDESHAWLRARMRGLATASPTDLVVARAADRDPDAVARVLTLLSDMLLEEARCILGEALAHGAEDVVQDLGEALLEGLLSFDRGRRGGIGFLRRTVRMMARQWRRDAEDNGVLAVDACEEGRE